MDGSEQATVYEEVETPERNDEWEQVRVGGARRRPRKDELTKLDRKI